MKLEELARKHLPDGFEDEEQRLRQRSALIEASTHPRSTGGRWVALLFLATASIAAAVGVALVLQPDTESLTGDDGTRYGESSWIAAADQDRRLTQGTHTIVVRSGARMRAHRLRRDAVHLDVGEGVVDLEIDPKREASWKISAGPYDVLVVGTVLAVDWTPHTRSLRVPVFKGEVRVVENGAARRDFRVLAGERLIADEEGVRVERKRKDKRVPEPVKVQPDERRSEPKRPREPPNLWREMALQGDFKRAMDQVDKEGFTSVLKRTDSESLLLLGDVARLAAQPKKAEAAYEKVVSSRATPRDSQAARFRLARLFVDRGDHRSAARLFSTYLDFDGPKPLEEEANGRLLDSLLKSGQENAAKAAAVRYLRRKLDGPWRSKAEATVAP